MSIAEPRHRHSGMPLEEWIALQVAELGIDQVGFWQIVPVGRGSFGLMGAELDFGFALHGVALFLNSDTNVVRESAIAGGMPLGRLVTLIVTLLAILAVPVYLRYGTVNPCGVVRVQAREAAQREGGPGGALANVVPDSVIDSFLFANYHELTLGRCFAIALLPVNGPLQTSSLRPPSPLRSARPIVRPTREVPDYLKPVVAKVQAAILECHNKRLSGEIQSFQDAAVCVKGKAIPLFEAAHYNHMDLVNRLFDERDELAFRIDRGWISEAQADLALKSFAATIDAEGSLLDADQ